MNEQERKALDAWVRTIEMSMVGPGHWGIMTGTGVYRILSRDGCYHVDRERAKDWGWDRLGSSSHARGKSTAFYLAVSIVKQDNDQPMRA